MTANEQTTRRDELLAAALNYARLGIPVFPLPPGSKQPYPGSRGFKDATTDVDQIKAWWTRAPESNIGIATGRMVDVIDLDGPQGVESWQAVSGTPVVGVVSTPRPGGRHLYVMATGKVCATGLFPGVDFRGTGGYVVAPPSTYDGDADHPYQGQYVWVRELHPNGSAFDLIAGDADELLG